MFTSSYRDKFICKYKGKANWFHSENKNTHINVAVVTDGLNHLNFGKCNAKKIIVICILFVWWYYILVSYGSVTNYKKLGGSK